MEERKTFFKSIFEKPWEQVQSLKDNDHFHSMDINDLKILFKKVE